MASLLTKVKAKRPLTLDVVELTVQLLLPDSIKFLAGQFMQFVIGDKMRTYSIAQPPDHNTFLKFCIKLVDGGAGSDFVKNLKIGDEVVMLGPSGSFIANNLDRDLFFVATGVGVAPFASIVPDLLMKGFQHNIHMLFGLSTEEDVFYYDTFGHMANVHKNFHFTPLLKEPQAHWPGEVGKVTSFLEVNYQKFKDCVFYVSGSPQNVQDVRSILLKLGHSVTDIKMEIFV